MYHVSAQGVDERMINVPYYYYYFVVDGFYLALFSALEQTHCARM